MKANQPIWKKFVIGFWLLCLVLYPAQTATSAAAPVSLNPPPDSGEIGQQQTAPGLINGPQLTYLPIVFFQDPAPPAGSRQTALALYQSQYLVSPGINSEWTGSITGCNPGSTSQAFRDAVLRRINDFRTAAGVPAAVTFSSIDNQKAQAAALMMSANGALSHAPPNSWKCYTANGADGAGHSDLYLGVSGYDAVTGYIMDPGSGNYFVGHRRWILYPPAVVMGTGDIPANPNGDSANALYVLDGLNFGNPPQTRDGFVAWPPPGFIPYLLVFSRWSFSIAGANFNNSQIVMTQGVVDLPVKVETPNQGYGDNTVVWTPNNITDYSTWPKPGSDTTVDVTLSNVLINNIAHTYHYTVILFDPDK